MAIISSFDTDSNIQDIDLLLGSDGNNNNVTKNFTIGGLKTYIANAIEVDNLTDENFYLTGVTAATDTGVITFSITGADDQTLDLGTSIFKDADYFATASHTHSLSDIVTANSITTTHLDVASTGTSGQILTSDGTGGFNWVNASSVTDTNNYLNGITKSGNTLTFAVSGDVANQTFQFGEAAFLSVNTIVNRVEENINVASITNGLGSLSSKSTVNSADIDANAIVASKITDGTITEPKLSVTNSPVSGYVLTSDGGDNFTWAANSASNYYLNNISKTGNKLTFEITGGLDSANYPTYTFGDAAFKDIDTVTGRNSSKVPPANHTHTVAHITDIGALGSLNSVNTSEISDSAVTAIKLSPSVGTSGQVLSVDGAGDLEWITIDNSTTNFLSLPDTPASFGTAGQMLKVNTAADGLEFADFEVDASGIDTTNTPTANKILAVDTNGDLEWIDQAGLVNGSITPSKFNGITGNGTAGQIIQTDGDGTFSYTDKTTIANGAVTPVKLNGIADNGTAGQIVQTDGDGTFSYAGPISFPDSNTTDINGTTLDVDSTNIILGTYSDLGATGEQIQINNQEIQIKAQTAINLTAPVGGSVNVNGAGSFNVTSTGNTSISGNNTTLSGSGQVLLSCNSNNGITVDNNGDLQFNQYGSGSNTGTVAKLLAVDSSGNVIETDEAESAPEIPSTLPPSNSIAVNSTNAASDARITENSGWSNTDDATAFTITPNSGDFFVADASDFNTQIQEVADTDNDIDNTISVNTSNLSDGDHFFMAFDFRGITVTDDTGSDNFSVTFSETNGGFNQGDNFYGPISNSNNSTYSVRLITVSEYTLGSTTYKVFNAPEVAFLD